MAQRTIRGTVTDANGPLSFLPVTVKGTTVGTTTNDNGEYKIEVPTGGEILVFSFVGYKTEERKIGSSDVVDVTMSTDAFELEEVVVTGYGSVRRKDITGSVSSVSADDIADVPVVGIQNALQGRAPGVQVTTNNGAPGAGIDVRVRGTTSISATNQPLYVIDGVPVVQGNFSQVDIGGAESNVLASINPNDIESIEVLKDASTAAIYGSRGANGVVLITTKRGRSGKTQVNLSSSYGFQEAWNTIDMLDTAQYFQMLDAQSLAAFGVPVAAIGIGKGEGSANWQDEIFRTGIITDHQLSISGGDSKTQFFTSVGYFRNEGIVQGTSQDRYSVRLNLDHKLNRRFKVGTNLGYSYNDVQRQQNDNNIYGVVSSSILMPPDLIPRRQADGTYDSRYGLENPVNGFENYQNNIVDNNVVANVFGEYKIFDDLTFRATAGINLISSREQIYEPSILVSATGTNGQVISGQQTFTRWLTDYTLNYQKAFGRSGLQVLVGMGFQEDQLLSNYTEKTNILPVFSTGAAASVISDASDAYGANGLQSYFGNLNYTFDDRYILTATFRADGYSAFAENNKFGFFPAVSAAWRISSEDFMSGSNFVNDLKLRVGYGQTGNNGIDDFAWRGLWGAGANYLDQPGIVTTQLVNSDLKWETTGQLNVGLDFTILKNRISGSVDYFNKLTEDLLFNRPIPTTSGYTTYLTNIGSIRNTGVELALTTRNIVGKDFQWTTNFTLAHIKNEVIELYQDQPITSGFGSRVTEGESIGSFFGYVTDGIFQTEEEIANAPFQTSRTAPGDIKFVDTNEDGVINDDDRQIIGSAQPDLVGGVTNSLSYKGFELNFFFQFSIGNEILNNNTVFAEGMNSVFNQTVRAFENRWTEENPNNDSRFPRAVWGDPNQNRRDSDRFVEDGSYLRLKTTTLAYSLPASLISGSPFSKVRVYASGQNLLTFTNYSWFDPEVNTFDGSNISLGTDFLTYPQARSIIFGVDLGF